MAAIGSVCVYCGSSKGTRPRYAAVARELGRELAAHRIRLIYGGGGIGLMAEVADAVMAAGGEVVGVIPELLQKREKGHRGITELRVVESMHERKATMADLADAFIALPGGYGTLEELFEVITWAQLGFHRKNIGLLNVAGYFDPLVSLIDHAVSEEFIRPDHRDLIVVEESVVAILDRLATHEMPEVRKWIGPDDT